MAYSAPTSPAVGDLATANWADTIAGDVSYLFNLPATAYTPSWTAATTNPAIGNGSVSGSYVVIGKLCYFRAYLAAGSTTTQGTGVQSIGLPLAAAATSGSQVVSLQLWTGSTLFPGLAVINTSASTAALYIPSSSTSSTQSQMSSATANVGTAGNLAVSGCYQTA